MSDRARVLFGVLVGGAVGSGAGSDPTGWVLAGIVLVVAAIVITFWRPKDPQR